MEDIKDKNNENMCNVKLPQFLGIVSTGYETALPTSKRTGFKETFMFVVYF